MVRSLQALILIVVLQTFSTTTLVRVGTQPDRTGSVLTRIAVGFPLRAVRVVHMETNEVPAPEAPPKWRVDALWLEMDVAIALGLFFALRWLMRFRAAQRGFDGVMFTLFLALSIEVASILGLVLIFGGVPAAICWRTRADRSAWHASATALIACAGFPWALDWIHQFTHRSSFHSYLSLTAVAGRTAYREFPPTWPDAFEAIINPILLCALLIGPVLLMRRFIPCFRKWELPVAGTSPPAAAATTHA